MPLRSQSSNQLSGGGWERQYCVFGRGVKSVGGGRGSGGTEAKECDASVRGEGVCLK